ncbi:MAG: 4-alpha-glucanotransferase [Xanthomonadales bacterium]|jgi:4-alpha-glucanotransferase|nr:4-alpha-glucanotransferase [Xanthomonadales bacterium]
MDSYIMDMGRRAGVIMHISSLPGDHGIGDIGDSAHAFVDALADMEIGVWQFLPLGPTAYGDSPYQPLSAFAGNANLIGLHQLVELGLLHERELSVLMGLPRDYCDYGHLIPAKRELLKKASKRLMGRAGGVLMSEFDEFMHQNGDWMEDYALFRYLKTHHGERPWPEWGPEYVHRDAVALQRVRNEHRDAIEATQVTQFLFDRQWRELRLYAKERGIRLLGDIPIYIALDSADAWAHREMLLLDNEGTPSNVAGVPPDYFSEDGQLWGNPLYDWDYHEKTGYQWWIERMQHIGRQCDLVRIDHFRGFESFWSVPFGETTAKNGEWVPGPGEGLFDALKDSLGPLGIVAEDLGVITPEVDALRLGQGFPGMVVLQFEVGDRDFDMSSIEENSVCYTGTHDNDTTIGWFQGTGNDTRTKEEIRETQVLVLERTGGSPETIHTDMVKLAFSSNANLAVAPMQDFLGLGSEARINTPGTTKDNWRWRMKEGDIDASLAAGVAAMVQSASRIP